MSFETTKFVALSFKQNERYDDFKRGKNICKLFADIQILPKDVLQILQTVFLFPVQ